MPSTEDAQFILVKVSGALLCVKSSRWQGVEGGTSVGLGRYTETQKLWLSRDLDVSREADQ